MIDLKKIINGIFTERSVINFHIAGIRFFALMLTLSCFFSATAQDAKIDKIDPPNWWVGMEHDTVQLLVYGQGLTGMEPQFDKIGPKILGTHPGASDRYLFVDVVIPANCEPGEYRLKLGSLRNEISARWSVLERAPRENRFQGFNQDDVIYLLMPDRFADGQQSNNTVSDSKLFLEYDRNRPGAWHGGDIQGVIDHLDYLDELGVTTVWLTPVLENAGKGSYHGYAATDYYKIDPRFGNNSLYAEMVESAHAQGIKVIFDHVNNHCGIDHVWVNQPPTKTWFNGSVADHLLDGHNLPGVHDPYVAPGELQKMYSFWFVDAMPDLNQRDPFVARYLIQQTLWWIEFTGLDGIREDTYPYSYPEFGVQWIRAIIREFPTLNVTGECWGATAFTALFQKDCKLPRSFDSELPNVIDFGFHMAMERYLKGQESLLAVYQRLSEDYFFGDPNNVITLLGNHDTPRAIFNAKGNMDRYKVALHILLTTRGIPQIFYGDELGIMGGESHVDLREDFPGGFPGDERSAFKATGRTSEEQNIFQYMQQLLRLRAEYPALRRGTLRQVRPEWNGGYYAYTRYHESGNILSVVNGGDKASNIPFEFLQPLLGSEDQAGASKPVTLRNLRTGENANLAPGGTLLFAPYQSELFLIQK